MGREGRDSVFQGRRINRSAFFFYLISHTELAEIAGKKKVKLQTEETELFFSVAL
jgi:hypothetical protein